ncbi:hypothetical protein HMSSN036_17120 [Paenibacillus macerans]|nr:hypothetical protein HMSSN036_17120 [Paenibacillus macerans]
MVTRKAQRIDIECVVRGYVTGGGWRQYEQSGEINGIKLPEGLRKTPSWRSRFYAGGEKRRRP